MIKDMVNHPADSTARCEEAYAKAQELQDKLNAVITFVDPKEQLSQLPEGGLLHGVPIAIDNVFKYRNLLTANTVIERFCVFFHWTI